MSANKIAVITNITRLKSVNVLSGFVYKEHTDAKPFKKIAVVFYLEGDVNPQKALRAAQLSFEKYCSVSKTLELMAKIEYRVFVNKSEVL